MGLILVLNITSFNDSSKSIARTSNSTGNSCWLPTVSRPGHTSDKPDKNQSRSVNSYASTPGINTRVTSTTLPKPPIWDQSCPAPSCPAPSCQIYPIPCPGSMAPITTLAGFHEICLVDSVTLPSGVRLVPDKATMLEFIARCASLDCYKVWYPRICTPSYCYYDLTNFAITLFRLQMPLAKSFQ